MSTFSSLGSKGGKPKFQSLDINRIYKSSRGESSEKTQTKSTIQYKHGMQILGKVPNARRPPANLPSLKSEHSGSEAAVPLVPPGGPGWGKQESNSSPSGLPVPKLDQVPPPTLHQVAPPSQIPPLMKLEVPHVSSAPIDKSWSSVMIRGDAHSHHPPPYQGPQFQHDFPSLSATEGGQGRGGAGTEVPYSSGLSLRPQTEGSWIGGGSGPGGEGKPASGHLGSPPQLSAQAGLLQQQQQQTLPPQYRGVMPSFMYKNNPPSATVPPSLTANHVVSLSHENNSRQDNQHFNNKKSFDEVLPPSIIKEEELHRMDEIERDMGWAYSDDIDYNKKLTFSDDEILTDKSSRPKQTDTKHHEKQPEVAKREINDAWQTSNKGHSSEEEEIKLKRTQHFKEVELAVQRAKQRKKEEEKRFNEATKQGAQQKLKELEAKISKRDRDGEEGVGTINPSIVPPKPIAPTEIPLPDFQREKDPPHHKEKDERQKVPVETHEEKMEKPSNTFKHLTEIEGKSFKRISKNPEREPREQGTHTFSKQFQNNLPPRFQRQQNNPPQYNDHYVNRPQLSPNYPKNNIARKPPVPTEIEPRKNNIEEAIQTPSVSQETIHKSESLHSVDSHHDSETSKFKKEVIIQEEKFEKVESDTKDYDRRDYTQNRNRSELISSEPKTKPNKNHDNIYERFQRLVSQENKMSRDKYNSDDNREYSSWSESRFEISFEDKRRDGHREDRRQVPGPITRDRIEADEVNESRNLTALKRGQIPEKKPNGIKNKEEKNEVSESKNTENSETKVLDQSEKLKNTTKREEKDIKLVDSSKKNVKNDDYRDDKRNSNRNKPYPSNKVWNNDYHHRQGGERAPWPKRSNSNNKNPRSTIGHKAESFGNIATDSEGSIEDHQGKEDHSHKNVKPEKPVNKSHKEEKRNSKSDKDRQNEKMQDIKRDNYVPRGEPSRLGRGGGNFRSRVGLSKRIDGYGPPPSKSPFTLHDDKKPNDHDDGQIGNVPESGRDQVEAKVEENVNSENKNIDDREGKNRGNNRNAPTAKPSNSNVNSSAQRKLNQQSRPINEKKHYVKNETNTTQTKQIKPEESNLLCSAIADISLKNKDDLGADVEEDAPHCDTDGFQEVKSKKAVKERPRVEEKVNTTYTGKNNKPEIKEREKNKKPPQPQQLQQPIHNIPPLMAVTVNPPHVLPQTNKNQFDRQNRQNKIPPRFVKLRENNRLQKMQQQHGMPDMNDMKNRNMFGSKMSNQPVVPISNAWDKPLGAQMRPMEADNILAAPIDGGNNMEHASAPGNADVEKKINKPNLPDTVILDGATPPVNTIIFENTNYKSMPNRNVRNDKLRKEDENPSMANFNKRMNDLLNKNEKQSEAIQLQLPFKEDSGDMKLDFFDSALSLPEEKALKNPCLSRPMHSMTSGGNDISTADALNYKIQSVKKVWETPSDHGVPQEDANPNFSASFVPDTNALDSNAYSKGNENVEDNHEQHGYSPAANQQTSNNTTNVCKVKPTQQVSGAANQVVSSTNTAHPAHSGIMGPGLMGNPLSPPPIQPVIGAGVGIGQPPQQFPTNQHIGYQPTIGSRSQYGMSTIPSPPSVLPYSAPPLQPQTANLYGPFQIDQTGVLGGQGRSQFSQYPNHYGLGQAASSPYSAQSMFLQTPQAHPPPAAQGPEIYQNLNSYRLSTAAFGQNQQLNNPTTVLISSTSNSLMSASVKPSTQQISAIGTKSGGVGQAYQQQSQQGQQMYMFDPNLQANYLQGLQRPPNGPVQNNVVPTIQPSSSYYSGSTPAAKPFNCSWGY